MFLVKVFFSVGTWYRFHEGDGLFGRVPEECPEMFLCNTMAPIWINGEHPTCELSTV